MGAQSWIKFLGTAGARFVVTKQLRASGGVWLSFEGVHVLVDPGPGCLVRCLSARPKLEPAQLDAILLSHRHLDHSNDINIMVEAMTEGGFKPRGRLFVPSDALDPDPVVLHYVRSYVKEIVCLQEGGCYQLGSELRCRTPIAHRHGPQTFGFCFETPTHRIHYITCTRFFPELIEAYQGCEVLLINTVRVGPETPAARRSRSAAVPAGAGAIKHLTLEDARTLIQAIRPRAALLTHFGMTMLRAKPWELAGQLSQETGVEVIAARDGMRFDLE